MKSNKGFTLVELLATIVLLSLVLGIVGVGIGSVIKNARDRNEMIFVNKIGDAIDGYIDMNGNSFSKLSGGKEYLFSKCRNSDCSDIYESTAWEVDSFSIRVLVDEGYVDGDDLINPANGKKCFSESYPSVRVFKDDEYVYYYYVDLSGSNTECDIGDNNSVISTLDSDLEDGIRNEGDI